MSKKQITISRKVVTSIKWLLGAVLLTLSLIVPIMVVYEFGYPITESTRLLIQNTYRGMLNIEWLIITVLYLMTIKVNVGQILSHHVLRSVVYGMVSLIVLLQLSLIFGWLQSDGFLSFITSTPMVRAALLVVSLAHISKSVTGLLGKYTNPSIILASSFAFIIVIGALLLMLPNSTTHPISWVNSLFLSTSAVCVTGLSPLDISQTLTLTGQIILLILIQIGGLGIMTITSFFGLFFAGGRTLVGQMVVGDLLSTEHFGSLLRTIAKILMVTFSIEAIGALCLYLSMIESGTMSQSQAIYFGIFHSISAFCNAGFSTLSGNLADPLIAGINSTRYIIGILIIFGGIGFPIFSNFLSILAHKFRNILRRIYGIRPLIRPHLWHLNSYIVVRSTLILVVGAFAVFMAFEWNHAFASMGVAEKFSQGFLLAVTPRTSGFNGFDLTQMLPASVLVTLVLMWIGGAPQSTAGGVKVTTVYVALRNILPCTSNDTHINVHRRKIPQSSVARAFGVITLSIAMIGLSVISLSILEPEISLVNLTFEAISAISTVGLSLSTTPLLCDYSKIILILLMFAGRVGLIALLTVFVKQNAMPKPYIYPEESILIN